MPESMLRISRLESPLSRQYNGKLGLRSNLKEASKKLYVARSYAVNREYLPQFLK